MTRDDPTRNYRSAAEGGPRPSIDTSTPHTARIYDYLLGGKDYYAVDREAGDKIKEAMPSLPRSMRANRGFMERVARHMATELGIRQFLDIGTGLPTSPNLHEVVQREAPEARILYVDNDALVLTHARALLASSVEGATAYLDADLTNPESIMESDEFRQVLDVNRPIGVSLLAILHFFVDNDQVQYIIDRLMAPLSSGSALALSMATADNNPDEIARGVGAYDDAGIQTAPRDRDTFRSFFHGLDLVEPGVALVHHWHPNEQPADIFDADVHVYGGLAVKP
jgi:hypothetical protein